MKLSRRLFLLSPLALAYKPSWGALSFPLPKGIFVPNFKYSINPVKNRLIVLFVLVLSVNNALAEVIFSDSFESGNLAEASNNIFQWGPPNRTSIVTMEPTCNGLNPGDPTAIYNGNVICNGPIPGKNWQAFSGKNSLRFRYPPGAAMAEQRFSFIPTKEVWISFHFRVPVNFSYPSKGDPNKFFALWMDGYEARGDGSTIWLSMWRDGNQGARLGYTYSLGGHTGSTSYKQLVNFITPDYAGKWGHIIIHAKAESKLGASDGVIETFIGWEDSPELTKIHSNTSAPIRMPASGPNGFAKGYLFGWANAAYSVETEWLLDDFIISSSPLIVKPKHVSNLSIE